MIDEEEEVGGSGLLDVLRDPVGVLRRRWRWMLLAAVVGVIGTGGFVYRMTPIYRASASLLVTSQQIPEDFVRTTVPEDLLLRVDAFVAQALTRDRLVEMIEKHDLHPGLRDSLTLSEVAGVVRQSVGVEIDPAFKGGRRGAGRSLAFSVSFRSSRPDIAAAVANDVAGVIQGEAIRTRTERAKLATDFLRREMVEAEALLRAREKEITAYKREHRGALPDELQSNLAKLERLQQQRQSLALQIAEAATRVTMLSSRPGGSVAAPDTELRAARARLAKELSVKTEAHPDVAALRREVERLEAELRDHPVGPIDVPSSDGLVAAEQQTVVMLRSQMAETEASIVDLDARVERTPEVQEKLDALVQNGNVLREEYHDFLRKVHEAELAESLEQAQQGERLSVLSWASAPSQPERNRLSFLLAGFVAALGLSAATGLLLETIDPVLVDAAQIESALGLPVLGSASRIG